jgi:hypothetical protein
LQTQQTQMSSEAGRRLSARREYDGFCTKRGSLERWHVAETRGLGEADSPKVLLRS